MAEKKSPRKLSYLRFIQDGVRFKLPFADPVERDAYIQKRWPKITAAIERSRTEAAQRNGIYRFRSGRGSARIAVPKRRSGQA